MHPNEFVKNVCSLSGKEAPNVSEGHLLGFILFERPSQFVAQNYAITVTRGKTTHLCASITGVQVYSGG